MHSKAYFRFFAVFSIVCAGIIFLAIGARLAPAAHSASFFSPAAFLDTPSAPQFAIGDLDGDRQPDLAEVQARRGGADSARYSIRFQLTSGRAQSVPVDAPLGGLQLSTRDVNGDSALDLVVTTAWWHRPVAVLLNDGRGHFTVVAPSGVAPSVWALPPPSISLADDLHPGAAALHPCRFQRATFRAAIGLSSRARWDFCLRDLGPDSRVSCSAALFSRPPPAAFPA